MTSRIRIAVVLTLTLAALMAIAPSMATAEDVEQDIPMLLPRPSWYTENLHQRILAAGNKGVEFPLGSLREGKGGQLASPTIDCLGYSPPSVSTQGVSVNAVSAGGCMVSPSGCTMNFIFADSTSKYIGTAGHCVAGGGTVVMQVATRVDPTETVFVTLAAIGKVAKKVNNGIGRDFGLVKINPGWRVVPGIAGAAGPTGVFCGDPLGQPVAHYGHGYIFFVEQGYPKFGEVIPDLTLLFKFASTQDGYNWAGYGLPGDSGSPVMNDAGLAVGNLTHGIGVAGVPVPGVSFGMTAKGILNFIGSSYGLVTVDGRSVKCAGAIGGLVGV
jgi:hypothetical protein